ncbi:MAG: hypothetical protein H6Q27_1297 [Ignavibacteriaceae bacterium]|nr:hypothetical protein [Ignavibacteriaceae bacterium]
MQTIKPTFLILVLTLSFNSIILSQGNPIQLSLFNPIQIVPEGESVNGIRLNLIYTKNANVTGFDMGLVNQTTGSQLGKGNFVGLQTSWVNYHGGHFNGLQFSIVNYAATIEGLQLGLINIIGSGGFLPVFPIFNFDFD